MGAGGEKHTTTLVRCPTHTKLFWNWTVEMATRKIASFEHRVHSMLLLHSAPKLCTKVHYTRRSVLLHPQ